MEVNTYMCELIPICVLFLCARSIAENELVLVTFVPNKNAIYITARVNHGGGLYITILDAIENYMSSYKEV